MTPIPTAILASGSGSNFVALAEDARSHPDPAWLPTLLLSDRSEAPVLERARKRGIAHRTLDPTDGTALRNLLEEAGIGMVLLAGYLRLVPDAVVSHFRGRILNIHPALLPAFGGRGMYGTRVHEAVLAAGVRVTGVTIHLVDERYDEGRILAQWPVPVLAGDDAGSVGRRVLAVEHRLYPAVADHVARALAAGRDPEPLDLPDPILPGAPLELLEAASGASHRRSPPDVPSPPDGAPPAESRDGRPNR
jgi:phosphoribosylglycinamide formyltransferase 1